jgi:phytol kinase
MPSSHWFQTLLQKFLPDAHTVQILLIPIIIVVTIAIVLASWMKRRKNIRTPYTRKTFHFFIFSLAGVLQYYYGLHAVTLLGILVTIIVLITVLLFDASAFYKALARETDAPHQKKFILFPLFATAIGGVISNIFFPSTAYIGYFVGGWGDAVGEPVGTLWGKHKYSVFTLFGVKATRSIEGSAAVIIVSFCISFVCLINYHPPLDYNNALTASLMCGAGVALIEAISSHGLDNLTIQVCAAAILKLYMFAIN